MNNKDYYKILGVTQEMTRLEIKKVFEQLIHIYHPDKGLIKDPTKFKEIKEAWSVLGDKNKRVAYDATYSNLNSSSNTSGGSGNASTANTAKTTPKTGQSQSRYGKQYDTSHSKKTHHHQHRSGAGTAPSPVSKKISNSRWNKFLYYIGQIFCFIGQAIVGVLVFSVFSGIVAPIIDFVLWIFGDRHWLTGTFIGLFVFSVMLAISLFIMSEATGSPKYRKVSYVAGGILLLVFLIGEGIPIAYSNRFGDGSVADSHDISPVVAARRPAVEGSSSVKGASYYQNKRELTYSEVKALQTALAKDKSVYPEGYITGTYGQLTHKALVRFQKKYGLSAEGYYGPQTQAKVKTVFGITTTTKTGTKNTASAMNSVAQVTAKSTVSTPAPVTQEYLTLRFVNQHGIRYGTPLCDSSYVYLTDALDEKVEGKFLWDSKNGYMEFDQKISEKQYYIVWKCNKSTYKINPEKFNSPYIRRAYESGSQLITYNKNSKTPIVVTVHQLGAEYSGLYMAMSIINKVGTPVSSIRARVYDSNDKEIGRFNTYQDGERTHYYRWVYGNSPGIYTLKIMASTYQTKTLPVTIPDLSRLTNAQVIALPVIDLGNIVLEKE